MVMVVMVVVAVVMVGSEAAGTAHGRCRRQSERGRRQTGRLGVDEIARAPHAIDHVHGTVLSLGVNVQQGRPVVGNVSRRRCRFLRRRQLAAPKRHGRFRGFAHPVILHVPGKEIKQI